MDERISASDSMRSLGDDPRPWLLDCLQAENDGVVNPALPREVLACLRHRGDWLAVVVAPELVRLLLLPGGGELWGDIPAGQTRFLTLGAMDWRFQAATAERLGDFQFCNLVDSPLSVADGATARRIAIDALATLGVELPVATVNEAPAPRPVSRRGFLRLLGGRG